MCLSDLVVKYSRLEPKSMLAVVEKTMMADLLLFLNLQARTVDRVISISRLSGQATSIVALHDTIVQSESDIL